MKAKHQPATAQASTIDEILDGGKTEVAPTTISKATQDYVFCHKNKISGEFGGNSYENDLLTVALNLIRNYETRPFGFEEFLVMAAHFNLPLEKTQPFFDGLVQYLSDAGHLIIHEIKDSCYNYRTFTLIK